MVRLRGEVIEPLDELGSLPDDDLAPDDERVGEVVVAVASVVSVVVDAVASVRPAAAELAVGEALVLAPGATVVVEPAPVAAASPFVSLMNASWSARRSA